MTNENERIPRSGIYVKTGIATIWWNFQNRQFTNTESCVSFQSQRSGFIGTPGITRNQESENDQQATDPHFARLYHLRRLSNFRSLGLNSFAETRVKRTPGFNPFGAARNHLRAFFRNQDLPDR
jgi:hypothetical protein